MKDSKTHEWEAHGGHSINKEAICTKCKIVRKRTNIYGVSYYINGKMVFKNPACNQLILEIPKHEN